MTKKEKKKSWKERQRERQIKQQHAQEAYQIQSEKKAATMAERQNTSSGMFDRLNFGGLCSMAIYTDFHAFRWNARDAYDRSYLH
jgi:hypothetical protein